MLPAKNQNWLKNDKKCRCLWTVSICRFCTKTNQFIDLRQYSRFEYWISLHRDQRLTEFLEDKSQVLGRS